MSLGTPVEKPSRGYRGLALVLAALVLISCGPTRSTAVPHTAVPAISGDLAVFAASSLAEAFTGIGEAFEAKHPGVNVVFNFAGTPTLRTQLEQGARADVFASANPEQMELAVAANVIEGVSSPFASNSLVVIVPVNGSAVVSLQDLAKPGVKLVLALEDVPVGRYARQSIRAMGAASDFPPDFSERVVANVVSEEPNVRQVSAKVALDEADAGIVYGTDVGGDLAGKVRRIEIPAQANVIAIYPIARVKNAPNPDTAAEFLRFVLSPERHAILERHGFGAPE